MNEGYGCSMLEGAADALGCFSSSCARWGSLSLNAGFGHSAIVAVRTGIMKVFIYIKLDQAIEVFYSRRHVVLLY